jgi:hypothetical protein
MAGADVRSLGSAYPLERAANGHAGSLPVPKRKAAGSLNSEMHYTAAIGSTSMRSLYRFPCCVFLLAGGLGLSLPSVGRPAPAAAVTILFTISQSKVSLHEPVYIQFSIHNGLDEDVRFDMGLDGKHNFEFSVKKPDGSLIRIPPHPYPSSVLGNPAEKAPLAPGKTFTKTMLLSEWYQFPAPGRYVVEAKLGGEVQTVSGTPITPAPAAEIPIQVTPRDPKRLESVCEGLTKEATAANVGEALKAAFALSYVDDPLAVPYLGRVLKESFAGKDAAISGLARIGNPEAVQLLTSYSTTADPELKLQIQNALQEVRSRVKQ